MGTSSGHITNLKQFILETFDIYGVDKMNSCQIWVRILATSGLYYKHVTIINDTSSSVNKWRHNLERHFWRC